MFKWNEAKRRANLAKQGVDFADFDLVTAIVREDARGDHDERRFSLIGSVHGRLYGVIVTYRGDTLRIISLRKANARERRRHDSQKKLH